MGALQVEELAPERERLREGARKLGALRRATRWLQFEPGQANELATSVYEYVNFAFLLDVNAFVLAVDTLRTRRAEMRAMFEAIGYMDAALSIGRWRATLPRWTAPEFTDGTTALDVAGLVHPLVEGAVPNALAGMGALITGSNMSGKSTFVRAVGLGAVLGQTLHTVCADRWRGPMLRVRTSIGRADSVTEGKSYYLAEAESVLDLVRASQGEAAHLFLLDEIFRGTNTTERVAAGAAVLAYLSRGPHLTLVATHDLELLDLLGERYAAHHFREQMTGGVLHFDYRLYDGPSSTRNAIALLEVLRHPPDLVADAVAAAAIMLDLPAVMQAGRCRTATMPARMLRSRLQAEGGGQAEGAARGMTPTSCVVRARYRAVGCRLSGPQRGFDNLGFATLEWIGWLNHQRLPGPLD